MIQKLHKKIFWSIELSAVSVLFCILAVYNVIHFIQSEKEEWQMLSVVLTQMDGAEGLSDTVMPGRKFIGGAGKRGHAGRGMAEIVKNLVSDEIGVAEVDGNNQLVMSLGFLQSYDETDREELIARITNSQKTEGTVGGMKYMTDTRGEYTDIVILDAGYIDGDILRMLLISILGLLVAGVLFGIFALRLSADIVRPVEDTMYRQKQFIADASHELKTPVAVIGANISVLEKEIGQNRWLDYIKEEEKRMSGLISQLLQLSKLDYEKEQEKDVQNAEQFDLSEAVLEAALPFESIAFENQVQLDIQVPENMMLTGVLDDIRQIVSILLDNAIKHTKAQGMVTLAVEEYKKKDASHMKSDGICIHVRNTGDVIPEEELTNIFERFYKADVSRTYEGNSYGLGLAIAKSLTERNHGTISVRSKDGTTEFSVMLGKTEV